MQLVARNTLIAIALLSATPAGAQSAFFGSISTGKLIGLVAQSDAIVKECAITAKHLMPATRAVTGLLRTEIYMRDGIAMGQLAIQQATDMVAIPHGLVTYELCEQADAQNKASINKASQ